MDIYHKLELIQQIHKEQEETKNQLRYRTNYVRYGQEETEENPSWFVFFRMRLLIAVLLFLGMFLMEKKELNIAGIDYTYIAEYIGKNSELQKLK